jgi:hypothetical protein
VRPARFLALVLIAFATACKTLPFPEPHLEGEYGAALKKWTRRVALYSGLETRAFARMVYLSPEFVDAQAKQLSGMRAELPDQAAATLAKLRADFRQPSFFAVVYVPDKTANDWNEPNSVWRLALNLGMGEHPPDRVTRYETPFNAEIRALYPYLDEYSVAYLIRFPDPVLPPGPGGAAQASAPISEVLFIAAGALGKMWFHWNLADMPVVPPTTESGTEKEPPPVPKP